MANSYKHLDIRERAMIEMYLAQGTRPGTIATYLSRARSIITRDLNGNGWRLLMIVPRPGKKLVAGGYNCERAEHRARRQSAIPRVARKLVPGTPLWRLVVEHLRRGLSPAQIESTLARMPEPVQLSRETIYTALYAMPKGQLRASLLALMRRRHKTKRSQQGKNKNNNGSIPDMTLIDLRPAEIQDASGSGPLGGRLDYRQRQPLAGGHAGGAHDPVCRPCEAEQHARPISPPRPSPTSSTASIQPAPPFHDLRPGLGNEAPQETDGEHWGRCILRSPALALGARHQRKHQWAAPSVPAQGHRSLPVLAGATGRYRLATQHPAEKITQAGKLPLNSSCQKAHSPSSNTGLHNSHSVALGA